MTPQEKETYLAVTREDAFADVRTFVEMDVLHSTLTPDQRHILEVKIHSWWTLAQIQARLQMRDQLEERVRPAEYWRPETMLPTLARTNA